METRGRAVPQRAVDQSKPGRDIAAKTVRLDEECVHVAMENVRQHIVKLVSYASAHSHCDPVRLSHSLHAFQVRLGCGFVPPKHGLDATDPMRFGAQAVFSPQTNILTGTWTMQTRQYNLGGWERAELRLYC